MSAIGGDGGNRRALESGRGLPAPAVARATEKVTQALAKLGAVAAPARVPSADTMERSRGFGPFGAAPRVPTPTAGARALEGLPETWLTIWARARELAPGLTDSVVSMGRAESAVAAVRQGLARLGEGQGLWARARAAAGEEAIGRIAARFDDLRERLGGGLEAAAQPRSVGRSSSFAAVVRGLRGEAASVRQDIAWARELVPDVELGEGAVARSALERAEAEMRTAEYGLQGYATQQELLASPQGAGPGRISEEELSRIGTGITEAPPPQAYWNIGTVGAGMDPAFSSDSYCQAATEAVDRAIGDATSVRPLEGAELAAAIRDMGVPLESVDPNQLAAALSYVNTGASGAVAEFGRGTPQTLEEQRERLHGALRQFRCLAEHGPAQMDRSTAINMMWSAARIPGHAFEKMSDAEVLAAAQQTAAACNTPGSHEYKVGRHTVKLTIGGDGGVQSTSTRAPSALAKLGRIAKGALTVASFIPGPVGVIARGVQAGITLVNTVRHGGNLLDFVAAGASFVGAGAAAIGRIARATSSVASNVAGVATSLSGAVRGVQGVQRGGLGGLINGAAGIANGVAGAISGGGAADNLFGAGRALGQVGAGVVAAENYVHANRALGVAREALQQARVSGDIDKIRQAERQLAEAERGKRSAVLGGLATGGQIAGQTLLRNSAGQSEARAGQVPAQGRSAFQVGAEIFSRGMNTARGLNEGDLLAAGAEALGGLAAARQGTRPLQEERVIGPDGLPIVLRDQQGNPLIDEHGNRRYLTTHDFDFTNQASSVTDGLSDWRQAARAKGQAQKAVDQAEQALGLARASGNPEAILEAEESLRQARRGLVQAELGSTLALDNAAERFTGSVETFQNSRAADAYAVQERREQARIQDEEARRVAFQHEVESVVLSFRESESTEKTLTDLASDNRIDPELRRDASAEVARLAEARDQLNGDLSQAGMNPDQIRAARDRFEEAQKGVESRAGKIAQLAGTPASSSAVDPSLAASQAGSGADPAWHFRADSIGAIEGNPARGALYYIIDQALPLGLSDDETAFHPFADAGQVGADYRSFVRDHLNVATGVDAAAALAGPGKLVKTLGLLAAAAVYMDRRAGAVSGTYRGGAYGDVKSPTGDRLDAHHMPADSVSPLPRGLGPAIQMDPEDHRQTRSHGNQGLAGRMHREELAARIRQGHWREVLAIEIRDARRVAASKYNTAIREMLEYAKALGLLAKR